MINKSSDRKNILLIRHRDFSYTDVAIYHQLVKRFPECEVSIFNVYDIYKHINVWHLLINLIYFVWEYGIDFLTGIKKYRNILTFFKSTSYFISIFRKYTLKAIYEGDYYFVFQLQTLFNGSAEGVPHFIYTDHITKANYKYPDIHPRQYARSSGFVKAERTLCQKSLRCFTMSTNIAKLIVSEYKVPETKVKCIYAGNNVKMDHQETWEKSYTEQTILFVGVDWKRKGGPVLLKAFEKVLDELPGARLVIIGCNPHIGKTGNVKVMGKLKLEELPAYFKSATLFCMPTLREPFGLVFVEAMNFKLPVVSNNIGALPDMVQNGVNGYLIDNNVDEYASVMVKLLKDPQLCAQMGENSYRLARERYNWDKVGEKIRHYITEALPE